MKKSNLFLTNVLAVAALAAGALAPVTSANAAAVDVAAVVTDIAAQAVPIGLIGAAVLLIIVAIKGFKWVRRAF